MRHCPLKTKNCSSNGFFLSFVCLFYVFRILQCSLRYTFLLAECWCRVRAPHGYMVLFITIAPTEDKNKFEITGEQPIEPSWQTIFSSSVDGCFAGGNCCCRRRCFLTIAHWMGLEYYYIYIWISMRTVSPLLGVLSCAHTYMHWMFVRFDGGRFGANGNGWLRFRILFNGAAETKSSERQARRRNGYGRWKPLVKHI